MIGATMVDGFIATMPPEYGRTFGKEAVEMHAEIVLSRLPDQVRVVLCDAQPGEDAMLCVVAADEPGLLALVCAALVTHQLDVRAAQIFARRIPQAPDEAVDFFWVRPMGSEGPAVLDAGRVEQVEATLTQFLGRTHPDDEDLDEAQTVHRAPTARPPSLRQSERSMSIHFDPRSLAEGRSVLVLEAPDTERLLLAVTRTLSSLGIDIIASDVRTVDDWAHDRFTLEVDHGPLDAQLRQQVVDAVADSFERPPAPIVT
ncbi:MAG TPA: hypothetical protein VLC09_15000, partial [Polyangiaceae bacterium]|nr:hypothetical protein [Polyangiaceae bacterium]